MSFTIVSKPTESWHFQVLTICLETHEREFYRIGTSSLYIILPYISNHLSVSVCVQQGSEVHMSLPQLAFINHGRMRWPMPIKLQLRHF